MDRPLSRRRLGGFALLAAAVGLARTGASAASIASTRSGEMTTTGGMRPGPAGARLPARRRFGAIPVSLHIAQAAVEAPIETLDIVNGVMPDPTGPWVVSWYRQTARLGEIGNIVVAGHLDYWNVGPAVFANLADLSAGDLIHLIGDDGRSYAFVVDWNRVFQTSTAPLDEIVGATATESLTLITCGGEFDYASGRYLQRRVVRAHRRDG